MAVVQERGELGQVLRIGVWRRVSKWRRTDRAGERRGRTLLMKARSAWTEFPTSEQEEACQDRRRGGLWLRSGEMLACEEGHGVAGREVLLDVARHTLVHLVHCQLARQAGRRQARLAVLVNAPATRRTDRQLSAHGPEAVATASGGGAETAGGC